MFAEGGAGIGAHCDPDSFGHSLFEARHMPPDGALGLFNRLFAESALLSHHCADPWGYERRHIWNVVLFHKVKSLIVYEHAVFNTVDAGTQGVLHPFRAVRVRRRAFAGFMGLFNRGAYLFFRELRRSLRSRREVASGRHDLYHRGPRLDLFPRRFSHLGGAVAFAPDLPAVTAGHRYHLAARQQAAALDQPLVAQFFQFDIDVAVAAEVADEGDAAVKSLF